MMEPSFEKLLVRLADAKIKFLVVGGIAVTLQGYARLTEDVDILIAGDQQNVCSLLNSLATYGEGFASELSLEDFPDEEGAVRIVEEVEQCQIDIFTRMSGSSYQDLANDAETLTLKGREISYASKATLIRLKSSSVREKDRIDVEVLKRLQIDPKTLD